MSRVWFASELETVAMFWRIQRRDGVTLGFTTHDRDLWFDGVAHLASPGMVPSAIRKSADFTPDSAEVQGSLSHETITADDLAQGRFDGASVIIGLVDWNSSEHEVLYRGRVGVIGSEDGRFSCDLVSRKAEFLRDPTPRTSPTCRAVFCGPGCNLNPEKFTRETVVSEVSRAGNAIRMAQPPASGTARDGTVRWLDGPQAGADMRIVHMDAGGWCVLDAPLHATVVAGLPVRVREGCDHTLGTCSDRFGNAVNFRGEPFLPGNDLLMRYPVPSA